MPEFEEPEAENSSKENYTPSTDASDKPRTRRRSGGFKTAPATTNSSIGEVDAADALKSERLSGASKPDTEPEQKKPADKSRKLASKSASPTPRGSDPQPSPETLAAIRRVDARLAERKQEREARRTEREKKRPNKSGKKPTGKRKQASGKSSSGGLLDSILSFFGLGAKQSSKKPSGKGRSSGNRGQNGRPQGKGGNRGSGTKRRGGGKGRRGGSSGPRQNRRRSQGPRS
jgi:hypothetical protein